MDMTSILIPMLKSSPKVKRTLEGITGQPVDYVIESFNRFLDDLNRGPGIVDKKKQKEEVFAQMYEYGINMGFKPWEAEIAAAGIAGYTPVEVSVTFNRRGWKTTADEIRGLGEKIAPRFKESCVKNKILPEDDGNSIEVEGGTPNINVSDGGDVPPWRQSNNSSADAEHQEEGE